MKVTLKSYTGIISVLGVLSLLISLGIGYISRSNGYEHYYNYALLPVLVFWIGTVIASPIYNVKSDRPRFKGRPYYFALFGVIISALFALYALKESHSYNVGLYSFFSTFLLLGISFFAIWFVAIFIGFFWKNRLFTG